MHIFSTMDTLRLVLCVILLTTPLVISKIVVEAKDEHNLSSHSTPTTQTLVATTEEDYDYGDCVFGEYQCPDKTCIDADRLCDNFEDCDDGADELGCSEYNGNYEYECGDFACGDGVCLEFSETCDGFEDCSDGRDEINCNSTCLDSQMRCGDKSCVDKNKTCDGNFDCPDGLDENGCPDITITVKTTTTSTTTESLEFTIDPDYPGYGECDENDDTKFLCDDSLCLDIHQVCNGAIECYDGTDEQNCPTTGASSSIITTKSSFSSTVRGSITASPIQSTTRPSGMCGANLFQCNSGECIDQSKTCDSRNDCADGSDENACTTGGSSPIMSAIVTKSSLFCEFEGATYPTDTDINGDKCGGTRCNSSGQVIVWDDPTCSASSAKLNLLLLGIMVPLCMLFSLLWDT